MTRRTMWSMLGMLIVLPAMAYGAGGWAIVTVDDVPEYLVAGKPTEIGFTVRQHGATPLNGLQARIDGRRWLKHTTAPGKATGGAGHYVLRPTRVPRQSTGWRVLRLGVPKAARQAARRALATGGEAKVTVSVVARDQQNESSLRQRKLKLHP